VGAGSSRGGGRPHDHRRATPTPECSAFALEHLECLADVMAELSLSELERLSGSLLRTYCNDKQVFTLGNGGSSSTASHMAADLVKNTISLTCTVSRIACLSDNVSIMTALANDLG